MPYSFKGGYARDAYQTLWTHAAHLQNRQRSQHHITPSYMELYCEPTNLNVTSETKLYQSPKILSGAAHYTNTIDLFLYPSHRPGVGVSIRTLSYTMPLLQPIYFCIHHIINCSQCQPCFNN